MLFDFVGRNIRIVNDKWLETKGHLPDQLAHLEFACGRRAVSPEPGLAMPQNIEQQMSRKRRFAVGRAVGLDRLDVQDEQPGPKPSALPLSYGSNVDGAIAGPVPTRSRRPVTPLKVFYLLGLSKMKN